MECREGAVLSGVLSEQRRERAHVGLAGAEDSLVGDRAAGFDRVLRDAGAAAGVGEADGGAVHAVRPAGARSEEHTSELQSLMRISYAVFCLKTKKRNTHKTTRTHTL